MLPIYQCYQYITFIVIKLNKSITYETIFNIIIIIKKYLLNKNNVMYKLWRESSKRKMRNQKSFSVIKEERKLIIIKILSSYGNTSIIDLK